MAHKNDLTFLGRVPIDTVLVALLDAVSKGDLPAAGVTGEEAITGLSLEQNEGRSFPLLERYLDTTSSKVWKDITKGIVDGIEARRRVFIERLGQSTA